MVEEQAAGRVHRIGQTRPVTINRYIVENSIEEVRKSSLATNNSLADFCNRGSRKCRNENSGSRTCRLLKNQNHWLRNYST